MNAQELRIGNFISDLNASDSFFAEVKKLDFSRCYYGQFHSAYSDLKPIPLTEDPFSEDSSQIIYGFGFKFSYEESHWCKEGCPVSLEIQKDGTVSVFTVLSDSCGYEVFLCSIRFAHQLQNLYHALTGEELTIKEQAE